MNFSSKLFINFSLLLVCFTFFGCKASTPSTSDFKVLNSSVQNGDVWLLNRPVDIFFNRAIDPTSVSFSSIIIRPTDSANWGSPVTGTFELISDVQGNEDFGVRFIPACPTNEANDNGGFIPGSFNYELLLPTESTGNSVLRDIYGNTLSTGLTRNFQTPAIGDPYFSDTAIGAPVITGFEAPVELGLFSMEPASFRITFNQSIDPSPANFESDRIFVQYAEANGLFPATGNVIPGSWLVVSNCGFGAELLFQVSGILLPDRKVRVVITPDFLDIGGVSNNVEVFYPDSALGQTDVTLPSLTDLYDNGNTFDAAEITYDQFQDDYLIVAGLDFDAAIAQPLADTEQGEIVASFNFPGEANLSNEDFLVSASMGSLLLNTTGTHPVVDGLGRSFQIVEGVLNVKDLRVEAGARLAAVGENPLIIYASGDVFILGELDASGFSAEDTDGASSRPDIIVPGASGNCGGGKGGDASTTTTNVTFFGDAGSGPFGSSLGGGQGGEGGFQQDQNFAAVGGAAGDPIDTRFLIAGGGGGGGFALTRTDAVFWDEWATADNPTTHDNAGPDLRIDRHTIFNGTIDPDTYFVGAESGLRGSSANSGFNGNPPTPHGVHGFQDGGEDADASDDAGNFDTPQTGGAIDYEFGNPVNGPDGGLGGNSVFVDGDLSNDFYGVRYFWDGVAAEPIQVTGELLAPYAGAGGGGSGDIQTLLRQLDLDLDENVDLLTDHYPDTAFPNGYTARYLRGAGGGGGGGQVQIHAIGPLVFGPSTSIKVNGGSGAGGESSSGGAVAGATTQVSGSGGGSGGHLILSSATGLNLSSINVGTAGNPANPGTFFNNLTPNYALQAIGGRRGWANSSEAVTFGVGDQAENDFDGNGSFMTGRGGAGASGVIQIHLPNPVTDIVYEASVDAAFKQYVTGLDLSNPAISDRQDEILSLYAIPVPFTLMPFFSPESQVQSKWIDTGLAGLRGPVNGGAGPWPDYADSELSFEGIDSATGLANTTVANDSNTYLEAGTVLASLSGTTTDSAIDFTVTFSNASDSFDSIFLFNSELLIGCDLVDDIGLGVDAQKYEIVSAVYSGSLTDELRITTSQSHGNPVLTANWGVRARFFGVETGDVKDRLPNSASIRIQFQGADEDPLQPNTPDLTSLTDWTGDGVTTLIDLRGKRFVRYRVTFDIDALSQGDFYSRSRPSLQFMKIPIAW